MTSVVLVALGGALGSVARFLASQWSQRLLGPQFPWGTFLVNVTGCFFFGVIAGLLPARQVPGASFRLFLLVGVMGGFTTYSSFAFETIELVNAGRVVPAMAHVVGQLTVATMAMAAGLLLAR